MKSQLKLKDLRVGRRFSIYWNGKTTFIKLNLSNITSGTEGSFANAFNENSKTRVYCDPNWPIWLK